MLYCCHRINTVEQLRQIDPATGWGIEIDLRDNLQGEIYIAHDPFVSGELFEDFLKEYKLTGYMILNIKSERIEYRVLELLRKYAVQSYFFLDTVLSMKGRVEWVWVDCFTNNPLTSDIYKVLKDAGFKLCFVSPELQNQGEKLIEYRDYFIKNDIKLDMVCTKIYNIEKWK